MGIPTDTFTTYEQIGRREDLTDVITNITPVDTWFTTNSGTTTATQRTHEWQTDALAAAAANLVIEGDDATRVAITPTTRLGNYTQILRKVFAVTDTADVVDKAGRASEISYQTQNKLKELARDIEYALIVNSTTAAGASGTARQLKGVLGWIATNTSSASATGLDITNALINTNLQLIWAAGGHPQHMLVGGYVKTVIDNFSINTRTIMADSSKVVSAVSVMQTSFGTLQLHLHQQLNTTSPGTAIILGDMTLWNKAWLRKVKSEKLARTGAATTVMIEGELTLESRQEKGSGKILQIKSS